MLSEVGEVEDGGGGSWDAFCSASIGDAFSEVFILAVVIKPTLYHCVCLVRRSKEPCAPNTKLVDGQWMVIVEVVVVVVDSGCMDR